MTMTPDAWIPLIERLEAVLDRALARWPEPAGMDESALAYRYRRIQGQMVMEPIRHARALAWEQLQEIDAQKSRFERNVLAFLAGFPANHMLLTGARGTGKSSLVKAAVLRWQAQGLRLVEVDKQDLLELPSLIDRLADRPERFLVTCDDLSFEEGEAGYKALKSVLDGSMASPSDNLLICATSNRRHLLPERVSDNLRMQSSEDGELHPGEAVEEKISLSERFGLWISFHPFDQREYLRIVASHLGAAGWTPGAIDAQRQAALQWATARGSRSGRVAQQFAREAIGRRGLEALAPAGGAPSAADGAAPDFTSLTPAAHQEPPCPEGLDHV